MTESSLFALFVFRAYIMNPAEGPEKAQSPGGSAQEGLRAPSGYRDAPIGVGLLRRLAEDAFSRFCHMAGMFPLKPSQLVPGWIFDQRAPRKDLLGVYPLNPTWNSFRGLVLTPESTLSFLLRVAAERKTLSFPEKFCHLSEVFRAEKNLTEQSQGRFYTFVQANIDFVGNERQSTENRCKEDADLMSNIHGALNTVLKAVDKRTNEAKGGPRTLFKVSNRKLIEGVAFAFGVGDAKHLRTIIGVLDPIPLNTETSVQEFKTQVKAGLDTLPEEDRLEISEEMVERIWDLRKIKGKSESKIRRSLMSLAASLPQSELAEKGVRLFKKGTDELCTTLLELADANQINFIADAGLARSCPIYSGLEFEVIWLSHPELGSIAGGGRCDRIASELAEGETITSVGGAIGITRIIDAVSHSTSRLKLGRADVLLTSKFLPEDRESISFAYQKRLSVIQEWQERGITVLELSPRRSETIALGIRRAIEIAKAKGIPFVYFVDVDEMYDVETGHLSSCKPQAFHVPLP